MMAERPYNERPAAKPVVGVGEPVEQSVVPIKPVKSAATGCLMLPIIFVVGIGLFLVILMVIGAVSSAKTSSSSAATSKPSTSASQSATQLDPKIVEQAKSLCDAQVKKLTSVSLADALTSAKSDGATIRVNGSVIAGDWVCVLDSAATKVATAYWYPAGTGNGTPKSYVAK